MISAFAQDLRFALRQYLSRPGFTLTAVLILALGLGANTAIFSVVNVFLVQPLPFHDPSKLVALWERDVAGNNEQYNWVSPGAYMDWRKLATSFESISGYFTGPVTIANPNDSVEPQRIDAAGAPGNLLQNLGVRPLLGHSFTPDEDRFGVTRVAMIGYYTWQNRFGGASDIVGKKIRVDGLDCQIVGVMPRGFAFPSRTTEVWLPLATFVSPEREKRHDQHFMHVVARLRPGVSVQQARAEVDAINARYYHDHTDAIVAKGANAVPFQDSLVHDVRKSLLILLGAVSCVLLIACVNVANLLLSRSAGRAREISIRAAIGASRGRIFCQLLTESILLSLAGGAAGLVLAGWIADFLTLHAPGSEEIVQPGNVPINTLVFLFAFGVAVITGVVAGLFPAIQTSRADVAIGLRDSSRSSTANRAQGRFRSVLVTAEVALSLMLLIAAGLLLRSFSRLSQIQPGVRIDHTLTLDIPLLHKPPAQIRSFLRELPGRLQTVQGVVSAGLSSCLPVTGHCNDSSFHIVGRTLPPGQSMDALDREVGPGYFTAAGIPLLRGRAFTGQDGLGEDEKHPKLDVVVISESLARTFFPNEDPLGKEIVMDSAVERQKLQGFPAPRHQLIGIVGDVRTDLDQHAGPTMYLPVLDSTGYDEVFVTLHTSTDPHEVISSVRNEIRRLDPELAIDKIRTMQDIVNLSASDHKFSTLLFGSFAGLAVLLAAVGLYAVLSHMVSLRKGEIGIRIALGANKSDVSGWVLRQGMKPAAIGVVLGLTGAALTSQILKSLLFGIEPLDPVTFLFVPLLLLGIAALACYIPAVRASRTDPAIALRME